jgi:hypothetical protein
MIETTGQWWTLFGIGMTGGISAVLTVWLIALYARMGRAGRRRPCSLGVNGEAVSWMEELDNA